MSVSELHDREDVANLADKADSLHARLMDQLHQDVRAALNEAGLTRRQRELDDALDVFDKAQHDRRAADEAEQLAREALDAAEVAARWEVSALVTTEGNKSFVPDPATGEKRQVTAAVRDEWIAQQVTTHEAVQAKRRELRKAEHRTQEAKDAVDRARIAISIRRTQAELAGIHVQAIAGTLRDRGDR